MVAAKSLCLIALTLVNAARATTLDPEIGLEQNPSTSLSYDARSLFVNPAAIGFEHALNGGHILSSFSYGSQRSRGDLYSAVINFGHLGLGVEQIPVGDGNLTRYTLGAGIPITPDLYFGTRHRFFRGDSASLSGIGSLDLGLQLRPFAWMSLGIMVNGVNNPVVYGGQSETSAVFGLTLRPFERIDLSFDLIHAARNDVRGVAKIRMRPFRGLSLEAGYHQTWGWQLGLNLILSGTNLFSQYQANGERSGIIGVDISPIPYANAARPSTTLNLKIDNTLSEAGVPETFLSEGHPSFLELLKKLELALAQPHIEMVSLKLDSFPLGMSSALELFNALESLRDRGKKIQIFLGQAGLKEYLIASCADRIFLEPSGEIHIGGLSVQRYFLKGALDKIGVEGEFLARGDYKSAPEMFTRKDSSAASKRATFEELHRAEKIITDTLARHGRMPLERWKAITARAVLGAEEAKKEGLVDEVLSYKAIPPRIWPREMVETKSSSLALPDRIAIIPLTGDIMDDHGGVPKFSGHSAITPDRVDSLLKAASEDGRTRAIILRISSPGGEVLASRKIAGLIERSKVPVYVSMGDVAASGGYMISAPAKKIFATPLTYTGSIGVFLGKPNLGELYRKLDLNKEILSDYPQAGLNSEHKSWTPEQRNIMVARLNSYYDEFTSYVGEWRKLNSSEVEKAAQGRVWLGMAAKEMRLIDDCEDLRGVIRAAAQAERLDPFTVTIVRPSLRLADLFAPPSLVRQSVGQEVLARLGVGEDASESLRWIPSLQKNPFLYWAPTPNVN